MIAITSHVEGTTIAIRAQPGARNNIVMGGHGGALKVTVTAPAEDGRANAALVEVLRSCLSLKRSQIEIVFGASSRNKVLLIQGVMAEELTGLIDSKLGESPRGTAGA